ncbi:uncharacterized protein LOC132757711 [Ruditapes philippinarum]|uniref:uncharacterized protein LOC132757711 n=1 Tax=Ruditapes philippinarum TaxID=129788 RepID=UPI00295BCF68|nr:uncharacterized protein LOC132757711 [Ruditapes philippinarum]
MDMLGLVQYIRRYYLAIVLYTVFSFYCVFNIEGFPTGGFSHSSGLEVALKTYVVQDTDTLKEFLLCCLENGGSFILPFLREGYLQVTNIQALCDLDSLCEACTPNHVAKRASSRQGRSMLDTCVKVFKKTPSLSVLNDSLQYKHLPVVFGAVCTTLDIDLQSSCTAFLFTILRTVLASAVRLDKVGPIEAQSIQTELQHEIPAVIERHKVRRSEDACMIYPHIDIVQNMHDTMFSKLFYS